MEMRTWIAPLWEKGVWVSKEQGCTFVLKALLCG